MNPTEIIRLLPAKVRLAVYAVYGGVGGVLTAVTVGLGSIDAPSPDWLIAALAVYASLGTTFGLLAATNTDRRSIDDVDVEHDDLDVPGWEPDDETTADDSEARAIA